MKIINILIIFQKTWKCHFLFKPIPKFRTENTNRSLIVDFVIQSLLWIS